MVRKIFSVMLAFSMAFFITLSPVTVKASPVVVAVPAAITVGVGSYVVAALIVGGGAAALGYTQYSDEVNAHARRIWNSATTTVKNELIDSYKQALALGSVTMHLSSQVSGWLQGQFAEIMVFSKDPIIYNPSNAQLTSDIYAYSNFHQYSLYAKTGYTFVGAEAGKYMTSSVVYLTQFFKSTGTEWAWSLSGNEYVRGTGLVISNDLVTDLSVVLPKVLSFTGSSLTTVNDVTNLKGNQALKDYFAGDIAVPQLDDFIVYPKDTVGNPDKTKAPVAYNPASDTWANPAGDVYAPGDVVADIPGIKIRTDIADTPTAVGTIGGVDVNIRTGEKVDTGTVNPPVDDSSINFGPLRALPITTAFPFSLPWDVKRLIDLLVAAPVTPAIHYKMFGAEGDIVMPQIVTSNVPLIRSGVILLFVLGLVMITRKLLGGGQ